MKDLLPKLKTVCEEQEQLTPELVLQILKNSYDFEDEADDFEDLLSDNSVQIKQYKIKDETVTWLYGMSLNICPSVVFDRIIDACADDYLVDKIDDFLYPFFNRQAYYEACKTDEGLTKLILAQADISNWDSSTVNNTEYIIFN